MAQIYRTYRAAGDVSADDISDPMIISKVMATARGKRFLDDPDQGGYYLTRVYTQKVPHKSADAIPGRWITETVSKLGLSAVKHKIKSYRIVGSPAGAWAEMEVESYHVPAMTPVEE